MLIVKLMSGQDLPDDSPYKEYRLIQVGDRDQIHFGYPDKNCTRGDLTKKDQNTLFIVRHGEDGFESYELTGNAYVMNQNGKTIDSHGVQ